jgi:hypothetical protein
MHNWEGIVCRVCGRKFNATRVDATCCSGRCRQRLRRGGEFAYLKGLTKARQHQERERHAGYDEQMVEHRILRDEKLEQREHNRRARQLLKTLELTRTQLVRYGRDYLTGIHDRVGSAKNLMCGLQVQRLPPE